MKIKREHCLGAEEARRRVDQVADELGGKLKLTSEWEGDHLRVHGKGVSGRILAGVADLDRDVPFPPAGMRAKRGKRSGTQKVVLPHGFWDDPDDPTPPDCEEMVSGG